jgi:hypothetical protein
MKSSRQRGVGRRESIECMPGLQTAFRRPKATICAITVFLLIIACFARVLHPVERDGRWAILIVGSSGDPDLQQLYLKEISDLRGVLENSLGFPLEQIVVLSEAQTKAPGIIQYTSTRGDLQAVCRNLAGRTHPDDMIFVFIEGHGSFDGQTYKLNLPGPDATGEELASMLYSIPARQFVIVNATSCSGGSIAALSRKGTVLISATKSGMEKNGTHLGRYFVDALQENAADSDKNGRVSMMEAFSFAKQKVEGYYTSEGSMLTEHPVLDDTGGGEGQVSPSPDNGEGLVARTVFLDKGVSTVAGVLTPEQQGLERDARELENQIEALKYAKSKMPEAEYEKQLEVLLLRLAKINAKLPR